MKRSSPFLPAMCLFFICLTLYVFPAAASEGISIDPVSPFRNGAFTGIWIGADKTLEGAKALADSTPAEIRPVQIFLTTDWSNLNPEPWYVLTAGMYASAYEAELMLPEIQQYIPDAYIKYSGIRKNSSGSITNCEDPEGWLGTWVTDAEDKLVITEVSDTGIHLIYYGYYEDGSGLFESPYTLQFLNAERTVASEPQEVLERNGWRRTFDLRGDTIVMHSRYPDRTFYRQASGSESASTGREASGSQGASGTGREPFESQGTGTAPFYGIWCEADKSSGEAERYALQWRNAGFASARVFLTTDWSNLNPVPWYAVSVGMYASESEAWNHLSQVQAIYPDAYVKYSGSYIGS